MPSGSEVRERSYKSDAIVLRARNLGEADKIYTLLTTERGKVDAVGKGVRRRGSRLAGRLEFANETSLRLHRGRNLDIIVDADLVRANWSTIVAPDAFATAHVILELVDAFCELDLAVPDVYRLTRGALAALDGAADPSSLLPRFELRLLAALGYAPATDGCVRCERPFDGIGGWADLEAGGLACAVCRPHRADAYPLAVEDVANFRGLAAERGGALRPVAKATIAAARAADAFVAWHLGRRPKAARLLEELAHR